MDEAHSSLIEKKRAFLAGEIEPLLEAGAERVIPPCPLFSACGGCHLQFLSYASQLRFKQAYVRRCLQEQGIPPPAEIPIRGMEDPWHYRNKVQAVVAAKPYIPGSKEPFNRGGHLFIGHNIPILIH